MTDQYVPALRQRFLEDMRIKGLQPKTQTMYLRAMREFTRYLGHSPDGATPEELRAFQLDMKERGIGAPTFNNRLKVLRFFFATTCPRPEMKRHIRYQRAAKKIPVVLSAEEVTRILEAAPGPGLRYRAAFSVAYGGGLRASEVTHLKVGDIDSDRMLIRVDQGKGRKDRHVMLSPSLLELLRDYYREARPAGWLFPGRNRVDPIPAMCFRHVLRSVSQISSAIPSIAESADPLRMPSFAAFRTDQSNARPAMNSDIVKPIPVRNEPAMMNGHDSPGASTARPERTASQLNPRTPIGFPSTRPTMIATETGCPKSAPPIVMPAFASAKIGMIAKPTQGCSIISRRSTGESDSVSARPA